MGGDRDSGREMGMVACRTEGCVGAVDHGECWPKWEDVWVEVAWSDVWPVSIEAEFVEE